MTDWDRLAWHRPELTDSLLRGEQKLKNLMKGTAQEIAAGKSLIRANSDHEYVYRLVSGWACRNRATVDGRDQFLLVFLPGDLLAVKSMFVASHPDHLTLLSNAVVERVHHVELHKAYAEDVDIANL